MEERWEYSWFLWQYLVVKELYGDQLLEQLYSISLKKGLWTFILGWQYVALGVLIVVIVVYFPEGLMGWLREKYPERFGEVIDEKDRKAQVELK
jgi:hypothetical protein